MTQEQVLAACKAGIALWQQAFNAQDAKACANQYCDDAVMTASPFGKFNGRDAIQAFWQNIIDQGYHTVAYTDVTWECCEEGGYILTANWTMNKAYGVITREHWIVEADGCARLIDDQFEIQGER